MQAFRPLQRYFDFAGRSGRAEYWQFLALYLMALMIAIVLDFSAGNIEGYGNPPTLTLLLTVVLIVPAYAVSFRRLHDVGRSGWWITAIVITGLLETVLKILQRSVEYTPSAPIVQAMAIAVMVVQIAIGLYCFYLVCRPGDPVANRYGPPPVASPTPFVASASGAETTTSAVSPAVPGFLTKLSQGDPLVQIERLSKLRSEGALTDEEFAAQKTELLKRL